MTEAASKNNTNPFAVHNFCPVLAFHCYHCYNCCRPERQKLRSQPMAAANSKPLIMLLVKILDIFGKKKNLEESTDHENQCSGMIPIVNMQNATKPIVDMQNIQSMQNKKLMIFQTHQPYATSVCQQNFHKKLPFSFLFFARAKKLRKMILVMVSSSLLALSWLQKICC